MDSTPLESPAEIRRERLTRIRIGATGLAVIVLIVLLAVSFSNTASNEPELTPEAMAEQAAAEDGVAAVEEEAPQEPLAELGVAPATSPVDGEAGESGNPGPDPAESPGADSPPTR